jgi:hypothetical protein
VDTGLTTTEEAAVRTIHRGGWATLAVGMVLAAAACGGGDANTAGKASDTRATTGSTTTTTEPAVSGASQQGAGAADARTLDATIWMPNGLQVTVA